MKDKKQIYYKFFEKEILKQVEPLEKERQKTVRKVILSSLICFAIGICLAYLLILIDFENIYRILLFPLVLFLMHLF